MSTITQLPAALQPLLAFPNWIVWKAPDKSPICVRGGDAKSNDPSTWSTYEEARSRCERDSTLGLGFVLTPASGLACVDFDTYKASDPAVQAEHGHIIEYLNSYTERSPNGGSHVWVWASLVEGHRCKWQEKEIEVYNSGRYMTVSGNQTYGKAIENRQTHIGELLARFPQPETHNVGPHIDVPSSEADTAIAQRVALSHPQLWNCDPNEVSDRSKLDFQLCKEIVCISRNRQQSARVFMLSPRANTPRLHKDEPDRNKCVNRPQYVIDTIEQAFAKTDWFGEELRRNAGNQGFKVESGVSSLPAIGRVWPAPMNDAAFHGPVGEFIRLVVDSTEADVNALVVVFLTAMGCWFGRKPFFMIEDTRHGTNLFATMVGGTSSGRKGTTTDRVKAILKVVDPKFCRERIHNTGLGTGEGLVDKVRDPREDSMVHPDKQHGAKAKNTLVDIGVDDKRLLAIESEFAAVLQKGKREGNTLTQIMRVAWDAFRIGGGAKTNKDVCQKPHISMIGNITEPELRRCLTQNDMSNGFANRILWCCAKRSKSLPFSKRTDEQGLKKLAAILAMVHANLPDEMNWTQESASLWQQEYPQLTSGKGGGLFEDITARAAPQVIRIMMIYACLDQSSTFKVEHLRASLEVWRYCEESARYIFGDAIGDANANKILAKLAASPQGVSETDINNLFGRNIPASELQRALSVLEQSGRAMRSVIPTTGRPTTIWRIQA